VAARAPQPFRRSTIPPTVGADESFDALELSGKVLALMAVLLPAGGFLVRAIAFSITFGSEWGVPLAWSAPLPELAVTGLMSLLLALPFPLVLWYLWHLEQRRERGLPAFSPRAKRLMRVWSVVSLLTFPIFFFFTPGWPSPILSGLLVVPVVLGPYLSWRGPRKRFRDIWWVVVVVVLMTDVIGGLAGVVLGFQPAEYQFNSTVAKGVSNGTYVQVGEADGLLYLQRCGERAIYAIATPAVSSIRYVQSAQHSVTGGPSLAEVLLGATAQVGAGAC